MSVRERVEMLIAWSAEGRFNDAYHEFYHPDVVMQENNDPPRHGVEASITRQNEAIKQIATLNQFAAVNHLVDGDKAVIEWVFDAIAVNGAHIHFDELTLQTWKDDKIVHERFFYQPPTG